MVNLISVIFVLIGSLIGALGALVLKKGTSKYTFRALLKSSFLWIGMFLYGLSTIFYVLALKNEELSVIYPLVSTTYIWTTIFSIRFLREKMNRWKYLGLAGIVLGVFLIGLGS